jgi:hypothetical protein
MWWACALASKKEAPVLKEGTSASSSSIFTALFIMDALTERGSLGKTIPILGNRADRTILRLLNLGGWFSTGAGSLGIARVPDPAGYSMCGSRRTQRLLPSIPRAAARQNLAVGAIAALRVRRAVVMICGAQRIA